MDGEMINQFPTAVSSASRHTRVIMAGLMLSTFVGCAAFHPVRGVPAAYVPDEYQGPTRGDKRTIDLSLLVRTPPDQHRVAAGDVLSVYVPGVLGRTSVNFDAEVGVDPPINNPSNPGDPPTIGFPVQVRDDHTISLPQIPPLNVYGMTLHEVELALRKAYTVDRQIVKDTQDMILVSLQRPREHRVLVVRQEANLSGGTPGGGVGTVNIGSARRGTARIVRLRAYENDVLHALSDTAGVDGLPGLDAENTVYIIRRRKGCMTSGLPVTAPGPTYAPIMADPLHSSTREVNKSLIRPVANWEPAQPGSVDQAYYQTTHRKGSHQYAIGLTGHSLSQPSQATPYQPQFGYQQPAWQPAQQFSAPVNSTSGYSNQFSGHSLQSANSFPATTQQVQYSPTLAPQPEPVPYVQENFAGHGFQQQSSMNDFVVPEQNSTPFPPGAYSSQLPPAPQFSGMNTGEFSTEWGAALGNFEATIDSPNVIKIPIRLREGEVPQISEEDITLHDGDIVFIESRDTEVFYTGGLLGGGQYTLPRDYDLRILEAISIAESRNSSGGGGGQALRSIGGVSALNQDVATSASRVAILRTLPNGQRVNIEVDINKAMRYQEENILVQPGDMLILQYTLPEATSAFVQRFLLEGALIGIATSTFTGGSGR